MRQIRNPLRPVRRAARLAGRLFVWCCVVYVLLLALWMTSEDADLPARVIAGRVAIAAGALGPAFYGAWWAISSTYRDWKASR